MSLKQRRGGGGDATQQTPSSNITFSARNKKAVVVVVGSGPAGAATAKSLADKGLYDVQLFEAYPHPDKTFKNAPKAYVISLAPLSFKLQMGGMMLLNVLIMGVVPKPALLRIMMGDNLPYTARRYNFYYEKLICIGAVTAPVLAWYLPKQGLEISLTAL
jgi:hypothetical protein